VAWQGLHVILVIWSFAHRLGVRFGMLAAFEIPNQAVYENSSLAQGCHSGSLEPPDFAGRAKKFVAATLSRLGRSSTNGIPPRHP